MARRQNISQMSHISVLYVTLSLALSFICMQGCQFVLLFRTGIETIKKYHFPIYIEKDESIIIWKLGIQSVYYISITCNY